jgi:hypothetical protein
MMITKHIGPTGRFLPDLKFHSAIPGFCKITGLDIRTVEESEGGGYMVNEYQARQIVDALKFYHAHAGQFPIS